MGRRRSILDRPQDEASLRQVVGLLEKENHRLHTRLEQLATEVARLRQVEPSQQLDLELRMLQEQLARAQAREFGSSSERRKRTKSDEETKPRPGHGPTKQPQLPRVETVCELEPDQRVCPSCDGQLSPMADCSEDSELVTVVRREFQVQHVRRQKYRCSCNGAVVTAPGPARAMDGGRYSLAFACQVAIDKYAYGLPLDRQAKIMAHEGLCVTPQALFDQIFACSEPAELSYQAIREHIVAQSVVGADETPWRLLRNRKEPGTRRGGSEKWWAWILSTHDASWFKFSPSRSGDVAKEILSGFGGVAVVDRYSGYGKAGSALRVDMAFCWSHSRRRLIEAEEGYGDQVGCALEWIDELFRIEREHAVPPDVLGEARTLALDRLRRVRAQKSTGLVDEIFDWAKRQSAIPKTALHRAVGYLLKGELGFRMFLYNPQIPMTNNGSERGLRSVVVGRKTHYGSKTERSAKMAAVYYTLMESAKLSEVDPLAYLEAVVLAGRRGEALLPWDFKASLAGD